MDSLFKLCLKFVLLQVILSKSIRNNTDTDGRMDFMETSMEKTEQRILNLTNQVTKLSKSELFFWGLWIPVSLTLYTKHFSFIFLYKCIYKNKQT